MVICANILVTFLQTFDELTFLFPAFHVIEVITILIFCVEYILRIWTADYLYPDKSEFRSRLRFLISFDGIIDLLTILPFFFLSGMVIFRMLRVARIFHLFRLNARYDSFNVITTVLYEKRNQIISSVFIVLILMLASSLCMYSVEHDSQPEVFRNAFSGIWWSMSTLLMKRFVKCFFELLTQIIVKVRKCKVQRVCVLHFQLAGSGGCFFLMKLYH